MNENIKESIENGTLYIYKKLQKNSNNINYFFTPSISIDLYKPIVSFIDSKNITLQYSKINNKSLYLMFTYLDEQLMKLLKKNNEIPDINIFPIIYDNEDFFSIRCYLPQFRNKYHIKCDFDNKETNFTLPRLHCQLNTVTIDIRNIWQTLQKIGYNIEVKYINY